MNGIQIADPWKKMMDYLREGTSARVSSYN